MQMIALRFGLVACIAMFPCPPAQHLWLSTAEHHAVVQSGLRQRNRSPLELTQVKELTGLLPDEALAGEIAERGISFTASEGVIAELRRRGAGEQTVAALRSLIPNRPPSVVLRVGAKEIARGESLTCVAEASDPEGDEVSYEWFTTAGTVESDGSVVTLNTTDLKITGETLRVNIRVIVSDGRGGSSSASQSVLVRKPYVKPAKPPLRIMSEGKYLMVHIAAKPATGLSGSVVVYLNAQDVGAGLGNIAGGLPGRPCRVQFVAVENVAEFSFKEPPGVGNGWSMLVARIRPKNPKQSVRFMINWSLI